ncbi:2-C-methyl-D-erythritol 4-phosphate cytidylyltransferase [Starkeya koreensis]|uniref:2-C-methyl-D-erythritol 4-phosphate cytidylyltransferase n=1 Tax=Ancylobacter koreensis TaxID=266121 RepID=A0ABT0DKF2_9HYPH|nr:2-C-methyl-D-erythritol 4-phosphate cytidylyltransferase [Ancylobacter koreensis]MCK0207773.1 2-C-methyl-D-erythritol 4-phosphate cytidylyltransferase [Ancylobacter koreensis]
MTVQGLIQAAGSGSRLGFGPKAFVRLGDRTLLEHAVALLRPMVDLVIVAAAAEDVARAGELVAGDRVRVVAGAPSRSQTTRLLVEEASARWLVLHDVVHPFASPGLVAALLDKARAAGGAAPGLVNAEFLYNRDGDLLHAPGEVLIGQKPVAFAREAAIAGYASLPAGGLVRDPSFLDILERGGVRTAFVPGSALNIKIPTPDDLRLANALLTLAAAPGVEGPASG